MSIAIDWTPIKPEREGAIWLGYLMARGRFIAEHPDSHPREVGAVIPTFEEEVEARSTATQIYRELRQKDEELAVAYFDDLMRVDSASFMREYVWTYLHQPTWRKVPDNLRLQEFETWCSDNLANHYVVTKGGLRLERVPN
ncbi:MAG TPA: hypothetical protein VKB92_01210 [Myxococcales bacterium]|nr:hypothetical protein [Myxococcales bacterium]